MSTARVLGVDQLRATMLALPKEILDKSVTKALLKGAKPILDQAKALAPRGATQRILKNIVIAVDKNPRLSGMDARVVVLVRWKGKTAARYWLYPEFGTSKQPPQPFMRPAMFLQAGAALQLIYQTLLTDVPRIAATLSK